MHTTLQYVFNARRRTDLPVNIHIPHMLYTCCSVFLISSAAYQVMITLGTVEMSATMTGVMVGETKKGVAVTMDVQVTISTTCLASLNLTTASLTVLHDLVSMRERVYHHVWITIIVRFILAHLCSGCLFGQGHV